MNVVKKSENAWLAVLAATLVSPAFGATLIGDTKFDISSLPVPGWTIGGATSISTDSTQNFTGSVGSLKGNYPITSSGGPAWASFDVSKYNTNDIYIDFWAKMPGAKQGLKFLKIFGVASPTSGYSNVTFGLDYTGADYGALRQVSFGDGSSLQNDTQNVIGLNGSYPSLIGRSYGIASVSTPQMKNWASSDWGTTWHHFRMHAKFNSGTSASTEVNDGEFYLEIDGLVYVDAKGLFNRNYANAPIERIELLGYTANVSQPFEIWYDNIKISTGGFVTLEVAPSAPTSLAVQ